MNSGTDPSLLLPPRRSGKRRARFQLLCSWYGEERAAVEIAAQTRQPHPVGETVDLLLARFNCRENAMLIRLREEWSSVVGHALASMSAPLTLQDGVLTLGVRHSALIPELRPSSDLILKRIEELFGAACCREIRFSVGRCQ